MQTKSLYNQTKNIYIYEKKISKSKYYYNILLETKNIKLA